jgi:phospholipid N-methyltransferase
VARGEWFYATRVWSDSKKDYDPAVGFLPLREVAIQDRIRMLQFELKQINDNRKKVA